MLFEETPQEHYLKLIIKTLRFALRQAQSNFLGWYTMLHQFANNNTDISEGFKKIVSPVSTLLQNPSKKIQQLARFGVYLTILSIRGSRLVPITFQLTSKNSFLNLSSTSYQDQLTPRQCAILKKLLSEANIKRLLLKGHALGIEMVRTALQENTVTHLDFSDNPLPSYNINRWDVVIDLIKPSLTQLALNNNGLDRVKTTLWETFCQKISSSQLKKLSLRGNHLDNLDDRRWGRFCQALQASSIVALDLRFNGLNNRRLAQAEYILKCNMSAKYTLYDYAAYTIHHHRKHHISSATIPDEITLRLKTRGQWGMREGPP